MIKYVVTSLAVVGLSIGSLAQENSRDKASFTPVENPFYKEITTALDDQKDDTPPRVGFKLQFDESTIPQSLEEFETVWCQDPVSQGRAGTCWSFSTTSFFEAEVYRATGKEVRISELYTVYWEYVEKAREYIHTRGKSYFSEGSETNAVTRMMEMYGAVPLTAYSGKSEDLAFHDHKKMFAEMSTFLKALKRDQNWNEEFGISTIKSILNSYMGTPPTEFKYENTFYTPQTFLSDKLELNPNDYVNFMSLIEAPFYTYAVYDVPDNWWKSNEYFNVPLSDFMKAIDQALDKGYSLSIGGDVSESGYLPNQDVAVVPDYDIPSSHINDYSRQMRFSNGSTTDDHAIHLVGSTMKDGEKWYLIKDSGSGARNGKHKGYYFYHVDYVRLKTMSFTVHRDAVKNLLKAAKD